MQSGPGGEGVVLLSSSIGAAGPVGGRSLTHRLQEVMPAPQGFRESSNAGVTERTGGLSRSRESGRGVVAPGTQATVRPSSSRVARPPVGSRSRARGRPGARFSGRAEAPPKYLPFRARRGPCPSRPSRCRWRAHRATRLRQLQCPRQRCSRFQLLTPRHGDAEQQVHLLVQGLITLPHMPIVVSAADGWSRDDACE